MQGHVNTGEISREMPTTQVLTRKDLSYYYLTHLYIFRVVNCTSLFCGFILSYEGQLTIEDDTDIPYITQMWRLSPRQMPHL